MWKQLKAHLKQGKKNNIERIWADATFVITLQDGVYSHLFTIKIARDGSMYTRFKIGGNVTKDVFDFVMKYDHDIGDRIYIPERERYFMLVINNQLQWFGFSPFQPMTLSLYQAEKLMKQLYEIKYNQFLKVNPLVIDSTNYDMGQLNGLTHDNTGEISPNAQPNNSF